MPEKFPRSILASFAETNWPSQSQLTITVEGLLHQQGVKTNSLSKAAVAQLLHTTTGMVHQVLSLRQLLSKSSVKKYQAM